MSNVSNLIEILLRILLFELDLNRFLARVFADEKRVEVYLLWRNFLLCSRISSPSSAIWILGINMAGCLGWFKSGFKLVDCFKGLFYRGYIRLANWWDYVLAQGRILHWVLHFLTLRMLAQRAAKVGTPQPPMTMIALMVGSCLMSNSLLAGSS